MARSSLFRLGRNCAVFTSLKSDAAADVGLFRRSTRRGRRVPRFQRADRWAHRLWPTACRRSPLSAGTIQLNQEGTRRNTNGKTPETTRFIMSLKGADADDVGIVRIRSDERAPSSQLWTLNRIAPAQLLESQLNRSCRLL